MKFLFLIFLLLTGCGNEKSRTIPSSPGIKTSREIPNREKRVAELSAEIKLFSPIQDAEYNLFNVNGFSNSRVLVPGASSWNYSFLIKIDTNDSDKWIEGMIQHAITESDTAWINDIPQNSPQEWARTSSAELYKRQESDVSVLLFRSEGILYKKVTQH